MSNKEQNVKSCYLDSAHVLGETFVLFANLEGQLAGVAHDDDRHLSFLRLQLLQGCQNEHGSLTHA